MSVLMCQVEGEALWTQLVVKRDARINICLKVEWIHVMSWSPFVGFNFEQEIKSYGKTRHNRDGISAKDNSCSRNLFLEVECGTGSKLDQSDFTW